MADPTTGESYEPVLSAIATAFGITLNTSLHHGTTYFILETMGQSTLVSLTNYLDVFPLFTSKLLNYNDFRTCLYMMLAKEHTSSIGRAKALALKSGMNNSRTFYSWDHLDKLSSY
jgi:hypothetical protein